MLRESLSHSETCQFTKPRGRPAERKGGLIGPPLVQSSMPSGEATSASCLNTLSHRCSLVSVPHPCRCCRRRTALARASPKRRNHSLVNGPPGSSAQKDCGDYCRDPSCILMNVGTTQITSIQAMNSLEEKGLQSFLPSVQQVSEIIRKRLLISRLGVRFPQGSPAKSCPSSLLPVFITALRPQNVTKP